MKRWISLLASITMQTCLGVVYAWSTFAPALAREHGTTTGRSGLIFGLCIASFTASMVLGGQLQQRYGPRRIGMAGGAIFLAGYLAGAASGGNEWLMVLGFGIVAGAGIGFAYVCPLATGVKWFPGHKGLVTGIAVAGFGLGGVFFAKAGLHLLEAELPVLAILGRIGLVVGLAVVASSLLLFTPERAGGGPPSGRPPPPLRNLLAQRSFHTLFWQMFFGTFGGLLVIGNLKPIGIAHGFTPEAAARAVMLFSVGNAAGRVLWGIGYDRFGAKVIVACMLLLACGGAAMGLASCRPGFYIATVLTALAFGGCFVLFAARVAAVFGPERISDVYPVVFLGYGIAGLTGPAMGGWLLDLTRSPLLPGLAVVAFALAGASLAGIRERATGPFPSRLPDPAGDPVDVAGADD